MHLVLSTILNTILQTEMFPFLEFMIGDSKNRTHFRVPEYMLLEWPVCITFGSLVSSQSTFKLKENEASILKNKQTRKIFLILVMICPVHQLSNIWIQKQGILEISAVVSWGVGVGCQGTCQGVFNHTPCIPVTLVHTLSVSTQGSVGMTKDDTWKINNIYCNMCMNAYANQVISLTCL